jgi:anti-sigma regulatory factor (Ser/Thr protein kinase)
MVSAEELCVNIARYSGLNSRSQIDLFLRITDDCVLLKVRDSGKPFNPAEFIGETGEHITGLSLIRSLGCTIEYDRIIGFNTTIVSI